MRCDPDMWYLGISCYLLFSATNRGAQVDCFLMAVGSLYSDSDQHHSRTHMHIYFKPALDVYEFYIRVCVIYDFLYFICNQI